MGHPRLLTTLVHHGCCSAWLFAMSAITSGPLCQPGSVRGNSGPTLSPEGEKDGTPTVVDDPCSPRLLFSMVVRHECHHVWSALPTRFCPEETLEIGRA